MGKFHKNGKKSPNFRTQKNKLNPIQVKHLS